MTADKEKGIWSEFAEEELLNNQSEYDPNGLPLDFSEKFETDEEGC